MQKLWMRITTAICIVTMILASPGVTVFADEMAEVAATGSETVDTTQEEAAVSAEDMDSAAASVKDTDSAIVSTEDTDRAAESTGNTDSRDDLSDSSKPEDKDGVNSEDGKSVESEPDTEEETLVGAAQNPYPTSQDTEYPNGDGYYEIPCTYFAWQQVYDNTGIALPAWGNAGGWFQSAIDAGYATGSSPQPGAIAVWSGGGGGYGHVAYVTSGSGNTFTVNEGGRTDLDQTSSHGVAYGYTLTNAVGSPRPYESSGTQILLGFIYPVRPDTTGPSYSDFHVGELREGAFTILAHVTDSSGVQGVRYAVWTEKNGQDDLIWYDGHCTDGNDYYWSRVNFSEHNGERGLYIIHMYAYDNYGNLTNPGITFCFDDEGPEISDVMISDVSSSGYTVTCKVTDPSGVLRVQFPTWTVFESQDDLAPNWDTNASVRGSLNGNNVTFRVEASAHNNESGMYRTHIYAFDILGNSTCMIVPDVNVCDDIALDQLEIFLSTTSYTYNGKAKRPSVTVKNGSTALTLGTDYTVEYSDNIDAGTATVTITGIGNYTGTVSKTFTINQAAPKLTFASSEVSKTTLDTPFTNELTIKTDGAITFNSTNKSVATVNRSSGRVTIKSAGTTTITVKAAEGTNYKAGNAEYTLTVTNGLAIVSISDDCYGKTGTPASFHVEAAGTGITYQWQYRTAGMTDWKAPAQASAQTADYTFNLKTSYDNIEVRCIVSDDSGNEVISETRKANVFAFTSQPADAIASEGEAVNFEVSAIGNNVTYQWYYKRPNSTWKKTTVAGATTAVLPITASTVNDGTSYRCVITDEAGNKINSTSALLTVDNSLRITGISEDAYDVNGESVTFHIDAAGQGNLTFQWQYKLAGESKWRTPAQASAKTADYVFKLRPSYDNIEVRCIVTDASGNSVTSDVRKANVFAITGQPQDAELELGEQTTFAVEAVGKDLAYQWFYMRPEGSWKKVTVTGYNTAALVITANSKNDGTKFQCRITDGLGNMLISAAALLTQK